ncbi:MAG: YceI family protein, partial [Acidobacteriota bacterium]
AAMARDAILDGTTRFDRRASTTLGPADRAFYMDFHPFATEDGRLFVSTALFSQFNCIEPIYEGFDTPTEGTLAEAGDVFVRAARALEAEIARQIATSAIGDGFDPVATAVPVVEWGAIGLPLPERAAGVSADAVAGIELASRWRIAKPVEGAGPRLIFRFPPPLERYSGEVTRLTGELELTDGLGLVGATGWIEADTSSVTMGEQSLDDAIHGKMIHVAQYPVARFELDSIADGALPVAFGRTSQASAAGTFRMVGREIPLSVQAQIEPVIREDGQPVLHVNAGFELRLDDPFAIAGPDGPAPARDTLVFFLDFTMEPADRGADARPTAAP